MVLIFPFPFSQLVGQLLNGNAGGGKVGESGGRNRF